MKSRLTIAFLFIIGWLNGQNNLKVSSDFPGGNIVVTRISGDTIWVKPDLSFTAGEWFYWYFKVSGVSGKTVHFKFGQNDVFAKYGPAYSMNNSERQRPDFWRSGCLFDKRIFRIVQFLKIERYAQGELKCRES
ncbi:MAG: hypothetical protein PHI28_18040 [Mangrovibacterium sp.]|nr:hypothetical protein [Mangrovibacterium sp.]